MQWITCSFDLMDVCEPEYNFPRSFQSMANKNLILTAIWWTEVRRPDSRQCGIAASATLPAVTRNDPSEEWYELLGKIILLWYCWKRVGQKYIGAQYKVWTSRCRLVFGASWVWRGFTVVTCNSITRTGVKFFRFCEWDN